MYVSVAISNLRRTYPTCSYLVTATAGIISDVAKSRKQYYVFNYSAMLGPFLLLSPPSCWSKTLSSFIPTGGLRFTSFKEVVSYSKSKVAIKGGYSRHDQLNRLLVTTTTTTTSTTTTSLQSSVTQDDNSGNHNNKVTALLSSKRGRDAPTYLPSYLRDARNVEIYHPTLRPNGAIQLSVAENYMMEDMLIPAFQDSTIINSFFTSDLIYYQPTQGREDFRRVLCNVTLPYLLQLRSSSGSSNQQLFLNPNNLIVGAGCNAVLENLCLCLAEFGEGIMIPTPYYAAFDFDLTCRIGLKIIPVPPYPSLNKDLTPTPSVDSYYPTYASLENAYTSAQKLGVAPRILLLSHPNNPLGIIYPKSVLEDILNWCLSRDVHLVSDEIYAGSVYSPPSAQISSTPYAGTKFVSILDVMSESSNYNDIKNRVHWIYALSKDFCLSGLRVGMCYTENEEILYPLQKLNDLCQVSSITQSILMKMLDARTTDNNTRKEPFFVAFLTEARKRLQARSQKVQSFLDMLKIPTLPSEAGMFIWLDLQEFLPPLHSTNDDKIREHMLYKELVQNGLMFTPGISMKMQIPGFFRCVYTAAKNEDEIDLALYRLKAFVEHKRSCSQK